MRGKRQDGIKTVSDIHDRCLPPDEKGCRIWAGAIRGDSARVWLSDLSGPASLGRALYFTTLGKLPPRGIYYVPTCGHANCATLEHRRVGKRGTLAKLTLPVTRPVSSGRKPRHQAYTPALAAHIRASEASCVELAKTIGVSKTLVGKVKRGKAWTESMPAASVFSWAGAL